ncbi:MAG TPA: hypothetical protein VGM88_20405 [Kofleriaceae bacterium]|jgi:hypothetical protein
MRWAISLAVLAACQSSDVSRSLGARCDSSDDCDEKCLLESDGYPGGFCTISCDTTADCPASSSCVDVNGGVCLFTCNSECTFLGTGYSCTATDSRGGGAQVMVCRGT